MAQSGLAGAFCWWVVRGNHADCLFGRLYLPHSFFRFIIVIIFDMIIRPLCWDGPTDLIGLTHHTDWIFLGFSMMLFQPPQLS
jgi:hypothetical protein